jgi:regulator of RNase E activity RraA
MPARPELAARMLERGHKEGRIGPMNSWPIDTLQKRDVYVADGFGKISEGTLIGDNLGNSIFAKSGNGVVFDGSVRDLEGLAEIKGFNAFVRGFDPTLIKDLMLMGLNTPIRIGKVTVLPGDVVLAKREGVTFIPAHLAEEVVRASERISLRDKFGHQRLREGKYTPGQIDTTWSRAIEDDFRNWLAENRDRLSDVPRETIDELIKEGQRNN